jgi:hypothetical protein
MAKKHGSELLDRLKKSLPKAAPVSESPAEPPAPVSIAAAPVVRPNAPKLSVSLYPYDLSRLDEIKAFMQGRGFRNLSDSEALRLACRAVVIDDRFLDLYRSMQDEDGRRKKK